MKTTITNHLNERKQLLRRGLENPQLLDDGLRWVVGLGAMIETWHEVMKTPASTIARDLRQSGKGKGFHTMSAYDTFYVTEKVAKQAFEGNLAKGQREGCWEHVQPWSVTLKRIQHELQEFGFSKLRILDILIDGTVKCLVSKKEDDLLNDAGLGHALPTEFTSIFDRYDAVGIEPIALEWHDFDRTDMKDQLKKMAIKTKTTSFDDFIKEIAA